MTAFGSVFEVVNYWSMWWLSMSIWVIKGLFPLRLRVAWRAIVSDNYWSVEADYRSPRNATRSRNGKKERYCIAVNGSIPWHSYGVSLAIWDHCYLLPDATQVNTPRLNPSHAGRYSIYLYPGGMEGWVGLVDSIAPRPGVEPATFRSRVRRRTTAPPRQPYRPYEIGPIPP